MLDETRKNIGISLTRMLFRRKGNITTSFSNIFSRAQTALVILPDNPEYRNFVMPVLTMLQTKFPGTKLTLVVNENFRNLATTFIRSTVVTIRNDQLNFFFLPKKSEIDRLLNQKFDVLLDLNLSLYPMAAYLCRGVNAPLKVGFMKEHADSYYNFQYNSGANKNIRSRYEQLFRTLSMF